MISSALLNLSFLSAATALAVANNGNARTCIDFQAIVNVQANNSVYDVYRVDSNIDAVDLAWNMTAWTSPNVTQRELGPHPVNQSFSISARLCVPPNTSGPKAGILQIATHGVGFDKRYWDPTVRTDTNSYVNDALAAGYSILVYDRLGVGQSSKPDAYLVNQAPVQVEILNQLVTQARAGKLVPSSSSKGVSFPQFKKIVLVSHSYGTAITGGVLAKYGASIDGAILTGFFPNSELSASGLDAFGFEFPPENDCARFPASKFGSGTVVQGTRGAVQQIFMKKGDFETDMLAFAEQVKQPAAVGEFLSLQKVWPLPAPAFAGPVLVSLCTPEVYRRSSQMTDISIQIVTAEYDFFVCRGDCDGLVILPFLGPTFYPKASNVSAYQQERSGHGMTYHRNAQDTSNAISSFLGGHGL
jgi:pimeloyl-ACP methyl ester carboxylesterase